MRRHEEAVQPEPVAQLQALRILLPGRFPRHSRDTLLWQPVVSTGNFCHIVFDAIINGW